MKENKIYEIGKMLEISQMDTKTALINNRSKIVTSVVNCIAILIGKIWFQPLHYTGVSIEDFGFLMRLL